MRTTSGASSRACVERLAAVRRLADDLDVLLRVEDHAKAAADERLVVGDEDADHARSRLERQPRADGEAARRRGPASSSPP